MKGRKLTGGKYRQSRKKKKREIPGQARIVKLGNKKIKAIRMTGGEKKLVSLSNNIANIVDKKKSKKAEIKNVLETPSNRFLARQNVLVKGAIIETSLGKARITNRPGQEPTIQAVLEK
ncbi:MAG: 30S ribosomal protein S8e [Candidatus Nanoarchaeia archaeon]